MDQIKCPACSRFFDVDDWNYSTKDYFGDDIVEINSKNRGSGFYVCPLCNELVDGDNLI